jgi:hypothetical protein
VYQAKHRVCSTRSLRNITRAATLRGVRCKPRARRRATLELSVTGLVNPVVWTEISEVQDKLVVVAEAAAEAEGVACEPSRCMIRQISFP